MRKESHILRKLIVASLLLSIVCSISLKDGSSTCATTSDIKIIVTNTTGDTSTNIKTVCISPTDSEYVAVAGCKYYLIDAVTYAALTSYPKTTTSFACDGGLRLEAPTSGSCQTGYTLAQAIKTSGDTKIKVCVKSTNTVAAAALAKGCQYYTAAEASATLADAGLPETTDTFVCGGGFSLTSAGSGCVSGFKSVSIQPNAGGTAVQACISLTNSDYTTVSAKGCSFYKLPASLATTFPIFAASLTCGGVSLQSVGSGCISGSTLINVKTSKTSPSTSACINDGNALKTTPLCVYYLVVPKTVGVFPILSDTLVCGGITLKTGGSCTSPQVNANVKKLATDTAIDTCVSPTNTLYTDKGCGYFLVDSAANVGSLPTSTETFTCVGIKLGTSTCVTSQTKVKVVNETTGTPADSCVNDKNTLYAPEKDKGCGFFLVDSAVNTGSLPSLSETLICKGVSMSIKDASCAATQVAIKVRAAAADSDSTVCVSKTNPVYVAAAGANCLYYLTETGKDFTALSYSNTLTCIGNAGLTAPSAAGACPTGKVLLTVTNQTGGTQVQACYDESDSLYTIQNCQSYLINVVSGSGTFPTLPLNTTILTCTCASTTTESVKSLVNSRRKACIPNTQWRVNCDSYRKTSVGQYSCSACQPGANFIVQLGKDTTNGNPKNYTDACTPAKVPGCLTYGLFLTSATDGTQYDGKGTAYTYAVGCKTCLTGSTAWAATSNTFMFWSTTTDLVGEACPVDNSINTTACTEVKLVNGAYACNTCSDTTYGFVTSFYDASSKLTVGCLIKGDASNDYLNIDPMCELFSWGNVDLHTSFTCMKCKQGYLLKDVYDDTDSNTYKRCVPSTTSIPPNCKDLIADDLTAGTPSYGCYTCVTGYDKLKTAQVVTLYKGICVKSGRFSLITGCDTYDANMNFDNIFALKCGACTSSTLPCQTCKVGSGAETYGFPATNNQATPGSICVTSEYVDNCAQYSIATAPAAAGESGNNDCIKCSTGFIKVTTSATKTLGGSGMICISASQVIPNCNTYNNADLSCYDCKEKLGFDRTNWKCKAPTDVSASCTKGVMVGDKLVCITCPIGYTLKDGACVTAVPFCASLSSTGVCSACVQPNNYQLINNKCIMRPANCANVDENGACTACKPGFQLTADKSCVVTSSNTCPAGQFLSNGVCVTGTIANCQTYDRNGKCNTCKSGFALSTNGKECTVSSSGSSSRYPNAPPCPPDTNKFRYVRNPSDPNGPCVPVDVQCANPRDDGHCISCKDGEFAHTDGLCYKIVFPSN